MANLKAHEIEARRHFLLWFLHFRQRFYVAEGLPDRKFAKDLGVSPSFITQALAGDRGVGFDVALSMRGFFKRTLDELAFTEPSSAAVPEAKQTDSAFPGVPRRMAR